MKKVRIDIVLINVFIILLIIQGLQLFYLRNFEFPVLANSNEYNIELEEVLKKVEGEDCTVLQMKYEDGWIGEISFTGYLDDLVNYVEMLKNNKIYVKNYKIEKVGELKCFLEIKAV